MHWFEPAFSFCFHECKCYYLGLRGGKRGCIRSSLCSVCQNDENSRVKIKHRLVTILSGVPVCSWGTYPQIHSCAARYTRHLSFSTPLPPKIKKNHRLRQLRVEHKTSHLLAQMWRSVVQWWRTERLGLAVKSHGVLPTIIKLSGNPMMQRQWRKRRRWGLSGISPGSVA